MTVAEFLRQQIESAGLDPADIGRVEWDTGLTYIDGDGWVTVDRDTFIAAAGQVDIRNIGEGVAQRIRFWIYNADNVQGIPVVWNSTAFAVVPRKPRIVQVSPEMLRGEA